jgi:hypothetical protein
VGLATRATQIDCDFGRASERPRPFSCIRNRIRLFRIRTSVLATHSTSSGPWSIVRAIGSLQSLSQTARTLALRRQHSSLSGLRFRVAATPVSFAPSESDPRGSLAVSSLGPRQAHIPLAPRARTPDADHDAAEGRRPNSRGLRTRARMQKDYQVTGKSSCHGRDAAVPFGSAHRQDVASYT